MTGTICLTRAEQKQMKKHRQQKQMQKKKHQQQKQKQMQKKHQQQKHQQQKQKQKQKHQQQKQKQMQFARNNIRCYKRHTEFPIDPVEAGDEDENCFTGILDAHKRRVEDFYSTLEAIESTGKGCMWPMDPQLSTDVGLHWQSVIRMRSRANIPM